MKVLPLLGAAAVVLGVAHAAPAVAAIGPVRRALMPALAGIGARNHVALTLDDGPHPDATPHLLRLLDMAGVQATFFLLGDAVRENPGIAPGRHPGRRRSPEPGQPAVGRTPVWLFVAGRHPDPTVVVPLLRALLRTQSALVRVWPLHRGTLGLYTRLR